MRAASSTRVVISPSNSGSPTDGRLIRTLAAAPAGRGLGEERRDREVARGVDVAPAGERLGDLRRARGRPRRRPAGPRRRLARRPPGARSSGRPSRSSVSRGQLHRRREAGVGRGVVVGERQEAVDERGPGGVGPGEEVGVLRVPRPAVGQGRDHRDEPGPEAGRDRRGAAAAGHGLGRGEALDEAVERQVAEAVRAGGRHRAIVGVTAARGRPRTEGRGDRPEAQPDRASERGGRGTGAPAPRPTLPPCGGGIRQRRDRRRRVGGLRPRGAPRSRPVTVQRRDRWWKVRESRAPGVSTSKSVRGPVTTG